MFNFIKTIESWTCLKLNKKNFKLIKSNIQFESQIGFINIVDYYLILIGMDGMVNKSLTLFFKY